MGETSNLIWWSPDFWTINSSTLGKESSITLHKPWSYCFINFFNAWNPKQPTFFNGWKSWFPTISQVLKNCLFNHPNWNHLLKIPLSFPGPTCQPGLQYLWKKTSSHENGGNSARGGRLWCWPRSWWTKGFCPGHLASGPRSVQSTQTNPIRVESTVESIPGECLKPVRSVGVFVFLVV